MSIREVFGASMLVLAACSGNAATNDATVVDPVANASGAAPAQARSAATGDSGATPRPGELRTFGDWTVGCDNTGACKAASLAPEGGDQPAVLLAIERAGGADGAVAVHALSTEMIPLPLRISVDGTPVVRGGETLDASTVIRGDPARRIVAAAANGRTLGIADGGDLSTSTVSLTGLSASLRYMDAEQGLAGSTAAFVAKGPALPNPPARPTPRIVALTPGGTAVTPTPAQIAEMNRLAECELPEGIDAAPEATAVGGGTTLVVLPCSSGAYNVIGALFTIDADGVKPARTDAPAGFDETGADSGTPVVSVVNGGVENGVLGSYAKGRGLGDCGVVQQFVWDGTRLRLSRQDAMGECRGNTDFITTWRADVVRR